MRGGRKQLGGHCKNKFQGVAVEFKIWVEQRILGTRGRCLNLMTRDESQWMAGRFAFVEVPSDASCDSIEPKIWEPYEVMRHSPAGVCQAVEGSRPVLFAMGLT